MPTIREVCNYLESIAPLDLQEAYDNAGLLTGHPDWEVSGILCSLDCTEAVVQEAKAKGCNLIVAHHPIVFRGLKKITGRNYVERTIIRSIKEDVAIYAIHTNLDNVRRQGVNEKIGQQLGLQQMRLLAPKDPDGSVGSGMLGQLPAPMPEEAFLAYLHNRMAVDTIKHTALLGKAIHTVALCGGAGGFLLSAAKAAGAQVFITADYKYHEFFDADGEILICDIGHYESEQFTIPLLAIIISKKFSTFAVLCTTVNTNPVQYYR